MSEDLHVATAVLPVKRFALAKQRLDPCLAPGARKALASAMLADVLATLDRASAIDGVVIVSAEPAVERYIDGERVSLVPEDHERGQSPATLKGIGRARELGADHTILVPGDCPLIEADELDSLVETASGLDLAIVPDRHGEGTNALALRASCNFTPRFGPHSLERHLAEASRQGLRHAVVPVASLALDLDTPDDLTRLVGRLRQAPERAPRTAAVLREIRPTAPLPVPA